LSLQNWKTQLRKGLLELCVLNLLKDGECYGYDLVQSLKRMQVLRMREGTIYPILARLEDEGLVISEMARSSAGPPRKYFRLTKDGVGYVRKINEHWAEVVSAVHQSQTSLNQENGNDQ